jgi:hypothetical protein
MPRKQSTTKNRDQRLKQLEAENRRLKQLIARGSQQLRELAAGSQQFRALAAAQGKRLRRGPAPDSSIGAGPDTPPLRLRIWGDGPKEAAALPAAVRRRLQRRTA